MRVQGVCPALRDEAYRGARLDGQLDDATRRFLADRSRNRYNTHSRELEVSKLFDWYAADFSRGWRDYTSVGQFLADHAAALTDYRDGQRCIAAGQARIVFLDYDWTLNDALTPGAY